MALPHKLKNMMLFNDGGSYRGKAKTVTLPALGRKMEAYRAAGMNGPVKADLGVSARRIWHRLAGRLALCLSPNSPSLNGLFGTA